MAQSDRIRAFYSRYLQEGLAKATTELSLSPVEQDKIVLLNRLCLAIVDAFLANEADQGPALDTTTSVMYAAAQPSSSRVLDVSLRSLVESNTLTAKEARLLATVLATRRTVLISGPRDSGRSTLLNALVYLLPSDLRVVAIQEEPGLPALRRRPNTTQICSPAGVRGMNTALEQITGAEADCLLVERLAWAEMLGFLLAIPASGFGLATVDSPDPEVSLADWLDTNRNAVQALREQKPIFVHVERDRAGRPRVAKLLEVEPNQVGVTVARIKPE